MRLAALLILFWPALAHCQLIGITLEVTDMGGNPLGSALPGQACLLRAYVEDLRGTPAGVFAAYLDVTFDDGLISTQGHPLAGPHYPNGQSGATSAGLIDEAGGFDGLTPLGGGRYLLWEQQFQPVNSGFVSFVSDPPDILPQHDLLLFGSEVAVPPEQVSFGQVSLVVEPLPDMVFSDGFEATSQDLHD